jgi:hypothetical protein
MEQHMNTAMEYRSQRQQDIEESGTRCGASCGPLPCPATPNTVSDSLQYALWGRQIWVDAVVERREMTVGIVLRGHTLSAPIAIATAKEWARARGYTVASCAFESIANRRVAE